MPKTLPEFDPDNYPFQVTFMHRNHNRYGDREDELSFSYHANLEAAQSAAGEYGEITKRS